MYEEFFGLKERPFSIAPDPQYLYMSQSHKEAMAHLSYGLSQGGGFIVLTGEVGTGKTTLCRTLLQDLPDSTDVALILNANINQSELLQTLCDELKVPYNEGDSQKKLSDLINQRLLTSFAQNRQTVLIIDEAQLLSRDVLEQIRLLTNLETTKTKLLKIILIGQPELNDILRRTDLRQLAQRVTARYHLGALKDGDVEAYLNRRLSVAGCKQPVFTRQAIDQLRKATEGIPRRINVLADHSMLAAYAKSSRWVDAAMVRKAASEVLLPDSEDSVTIFRRALPKEKIRWWMFVGLVLLFNASIWWVLMPNNQPVPMLSNLEFTPQSVGSAGSQEDYENAEADSNNTLDVEQNLGSGSAEDLEDSLTAFARLPDKDGETSPVNSSDVPESEVPDASPDSSLQASASQFVVTDTPSASEPAPGRVLSSSVYLDASTTLPDETLLTETPMPISSEPLTFAKEEGQSASQQLLDILTTSGHLTTRSRAFQHLAALWGVSFEEPVLSPYCRLLNESGYDCLDVGSWAELVAYNRPTIVVLSADQTLHRAIVRSVIGQSVNLLVGEKEIILDRPTFEAVWTGRAVAIWRYNGFDDIAWALGSSGPAVLQAKQRITLTLQRLGLPALAQPNSDEFDADTAQKLVALQSLYGLTSDGELGVQTKLLINEVLGDDSLPRLAERYSLR